MAAIDEGVPAEVLTAALYERFASRGEADFAEQAAVGDALRVRRPRREEGRRVGDGQTEPADALHRHRRHGHQDARRRRRGQAADRAPARRHAPPRDARGPCSRRSSGSRSSRAPSTASPSAFPASCAGASPRPRFNLHPRWIGVNLDRVLTKELGKSGARRQRRRRPGARRRQGQGRRARHHARHGLRLVALHRRPPRAQRPARATTRAGTSKTYEDELGNKALKKAGKKKWNRRVRKAIASLVGALQLRPPLHRRRQRRRRSRSSCRRASRSFRTSRACSAASRSGTGRRTRYGVR